MNNILLIASGGAVGALSRYGITKLIGKFVGSTFPWGTMAANFIGLFIIGLLFEFFERSVIPESMRYLLTIGFLGALTTFSSYGLESMMLFRNGQIKFGLFNMLISNVGGLVVVGSGMFLARFLLRNVG